MHCSARIFGWITASLLALGACKDRDLDANGDDEATDEPCGDAEACEAGLVCEAAPGGEVCAIPIELRGRVVDAIDGAPIEGAVIAAQDETGAVLGGIARSDANGDYVLRVPALRDDDGEVADDVRWTLFAVADGHLPFPGGVRPSLPIDATMPVEITDADDHPVWSIENPTTDIALLPRPGGDEGVTVTGSIDALEPGGTLVVAQGGPAPAPYTIADASGVFVLFDVPRTATAIHGYRRGLQLASVGVDATADVDGVVLDAVVEDVAAIASVTGSANLVDAGGGSATSVVLVPSAVFDPALERGPVPLGLRAPTPPEAPSISGAFAIDGVPTGDYHMLVAFENDGLVRDPDMNIAGTDIPMISVTSTGAVAVPTAFKVTGALEVIAPGADAPEVVTTAPTLTWADDSSEDGYEVRVIDAFGDLVWEDLEVPAHMGAGNVEVAYAGPALQVGMTYQFRATSIKGMGPMASAISRTEDLRGVFVFQP